MKIMFVGDLNLGEYYTAFGHGPKSYAKNQERSVFDSVKKIFSKADLVVGNLEAPITTCLEDPTNPEWCVLKGDPDDASQLTGAGIRLVQVANNHIVQYGDEGFEETLDTLDSQNVRYVGLSGAEPVVMDFAGKTYAFYAASDVPDNTDKLQTKYQRLDEEFISRVERDVSRYDRVITMLHWGLEESTTPLPYQRKLASRLKQAGVSAIIGSHPHLFYEVEIDDNFVCAYSLGNFIFDLCWDSRLMKSGILEIDFSDEGLSCTLWPVSLKSFGSQPVPTGPAVHLTSTYTHYDLGSSMTWQQLKKTIHFWVNIFRGNTGLKLRFFGRKVRGVLGI